MAVAAFKKLCTLKFEFYVTYSSFDFFSYVVMSKKKSLSLPGVL